MWHRTAMQQPAGAKRDLHMHAWLESVQAGQMSPARRSTGTVARYRLVNAWPSKVAAGLPRAASCPTVRTEGRLERKEGGRTCGSRGCPEQTTQANITKRT